MKRIGIIGFGKIGQAIGAYILKKPVNVTAVDTDAELQTIFKKGRYATNEPGVGEILNSAYYDERLAITTDYSSVKDCDAIIVAIPLLIDAQKKILDIPFLETFKRIAPFA